MNMFTAKLSPSATDMIRADHTRVLGAFHRYSIAARPQAKQGLAESICLALEVHAQIEEEIFYPAMRAAGSELEKELVTEHEEMRRLISMLRGIDPADVEYDRVFMELMRDVIHHVADEETVLLTHAESVLGERLGELGARMLRRRLELKAPRAAEIARHAARAASPVALLVSAGALVGGALLLRSWQRRA